MRVGRANSNVVRWNTRQFGGPLLHAVRKSSRNSAEVERKNGDRHLLHSQHQRPRRWWLANAGDAPFLAGWLVEAGHFNSQGRSDLDDTFTGFKHSGS